MFVDICGVAIMVFMLLEVKNYYRP